MGVDENVLAQYAEEVRSGRVPGTHPDSQAIWDGVGTSPVDLDNRVVTIEEPSFWKKNRLYIIGIILAAAASAAMLYVASRPDPRVYIEEQGEALQALSETFKSAEPLPIVPVITSQDVAMAQVEAWERVQMALVDEFFRSKAKGTRALCISMGKKSKCAALNGQGSVKQAKKFLDNVRR